MTSTSSVAAATPDPDLARRRARLASFVGTTIEWYDFYLYGTAAALVFPILFFPSYSPITGTLLALLTYSVGFVARPLGGVIMGHYGDRVGRKAMLVLSLLVMGVATTLIGVLPTYAEIGAWAPVLLLVLRLAQGFGVGGEWGGAVLVAVENAPPTSRGLWGAWPQVGVPAGLLLANGVFLTMTLVTSPEAFLAWGWRVGFLLSAVLVIVGLMVRLKLEETPDFKAVQAAGKVERHPVRTVLRTQWRTVLLVIGIKLSQNAFFYIIIVFSLIYVTQVLGLSRSMALGGVLFASGISLMTLLLAGWLSDQYGRRRVYLIGAVAVAVFAFPFFWMLDTRSTIAIWAAIAIGLVLHDLMYGPQAAYFSELFPAELRYTGVSLGYQIAAMVAGGVAPVLAVFLLSVADDKPWPVAMFILALSAITVYATWRGPETHRGNRLATDPAHESGVGANA